MNKTKTNILSKGNNRVLVGISGGVDSSVSALLLKQQGYEVEGVFAKVWQPDFVECTWRDEMKDAMRVCAKLKIPFHFLDLEQHYKKYVADYMIAEYQAGRTPNPDVMCNTHIKFGFIYDFAMEKGFDYVATGHYVQNKDGQLYRGADSNKDQSYFLWNVATKKFKHILFPIGDLDKSEVRRLAEKNNLFTAEKKDSQGLCFIGPVDMKTFLKKLITTTPGKVVNRDGEEIGTHEGSQLYTVGERHGFSINPEYKNNNDSAFFIIDKDVEKNLLIVDTKAPKIQKVHLANFIEHSPIQTPSLIDVQFRYRQVPYKAILEEQNGTYILSFTESDGIESFVALGQSAVLYKDNHCVGGAIIQKVIY